MSNFCRRLTIAKMERFILILGMMVFFATANPVQAVTTIPRNFDQLVSRADAIFKGSVIDKTSRWTGEGATHHIVTLVTFQVEETYKGTPTPTQTLRFLGGTVGGDTLSVPEMPQFEVGQKAVLFVVDNGKLFCPLVGVAQGRFHVVVDAATHHERVLTDDFSPVVDTAEIGQFDAAGAPRLRRYLHTGTPALTVEEFGAKILGNVTNSTR